MLLVNINGSFIGNIIIQNDKLYFSDLDPETNEVVYTEKPVNEYSKNSDIYSSVEMVLKEEDFLGFENPENIVKFKEIILKEHKEGKDSFNYHGLAISFETIPDDNTITII